MTAILGISAFYHDSAAALVVDGRIVAAAQEERFTRIKHDPAFPSRAIAYCLREAEPVSRPTSTTSPSTTSRCTKFERLLETYLALRARGLPQFSPGHAALAEGQAAHAADASARPWRSPTRARLVFTDHHESHAASAFFPSPFERGGDPDARRRRRMEHRHHSATAKATGSR